jgi:hypothetical protein
MLSHVKQDTQKDELAIAILVSAALREIIQEKYYEHKLVNINLAIDLEANFAFMHIKPGQFKRMMSNLINNAVEALENKADGKIVIDMGILANEVVIGIEDNGCGMPPELVDKLISREAVTSGKQAGNGIGFTQVYDTLKENLGDLNIYSDASFGTKIVLKFPQVAPPLWMATNLTLYKNDSIIILDDDSSIHAAWDEKLSKVLSKLPDVKIHHFLTAKEAIEFINPLSVDAKGKICLLADYELLNQGINGLEVIKRSNIKRSMLVTSCYNDKEVVELSKNLKVEILPKELIFALAIKIDKQLKPGSKKVDIVWVDDTRWFVDDLIRQHYSHLKIDTYYEPYGFMEDVVQYALDTKIILDTFYYADYGEGEFIEGGLPLVRQLHAMGYTNLFMLAGEALSSDMVPDYLTVILKSDQEKIKILDKL